ncbi:MAG TPA: CDP-diacylglycerol--glycerol-3-phosphate 3-phosphatidyltransferase [Clostridiales bacterium]|nr:CDP-diacylglycerol--glycerol-3-phosphate 3-phosphatidyltransferase [Clostridiales bacterium]HPV00946.1 CDP-diacylglycerol--glycerol-3-phosphate 3-phosphatidyltransferase [Clostridiales bacterium]
MNIPNILTVLRFLLIPAFAYFLSIRNYIVAVLLFLAGGLTDVLDGYIARKYNLITSWGKIADPLADKLMQITAVVILSLGLKIIPIELVLVILAKEVLMGVGALVLYRQKKYVVSANWYGKMTTVIFYLAIIMLIFNEPFGRWTLFGIPVNQLAFILAVIATLFAFFMYFRSYLRIKQQNQ